MNRQRIHIRAQADHATARVAAPLDDADDAGTADPFDHLVQTKAAQQFRDPARGAMHSVIQLGVLMEIAAPRGDFRQEFCKAVLDWHDISPSPARLALLPRVCKAWSGASSLLKRGRKYLQALARQNK